MNSYGYGGYNQPQGYGCYGGYGGYKPQSYDGYSNPYAPPKEYNKRQVTSGLTASCQKVPKFDFQSQFSMSKIIRIFHKFIELPTALSSIPSIALGW